MTTYSHTITISDSQRIALEAALLLMIEHCNEQMANGHEAQFWARRKSCEELWSKLITSTPQMTSTSSFSGHAAQLLEP